MGREITAQRLGTPRVEAARLASRGDCHERLQSHSGNACRFQGQRPAPPEQEDTGSVKGLHADAMLAESLAPGAGRPFAITAGVATCVTPGRHQSASRFGWKPPSRSRPGQRGRTRDRGRAGARPAPAHGQATWHTLAGGCRPLPPLPSASPSLTAAVPGRRKRCRLHAAQESPAVSSQS